MDFRDEQQLREQVGKYRWYHRIQLSENVETPSVEEGGEGYPLIWALIRWAMDQIDWRNRKILDIGCRDGMFSFEAEKRGAREVIGIDNDLSRGAVEFLIPYFKSTVRMYELNLYDLSPGRFGLFDVIILAGVLYHLRYPFWGLKRIIDCLAEDGIVLIEAGMLVDERFKDYELLYCPVEDGPYGITSCTFFNERGLVTTMGSLGCLLLKARELGQEDALPTPVQTLRRPFRSRVKRAAKALVGSDVEPITRSPLTINRRVLIFQKQRAPTHNEFVHRYWNVTHAYHTTGKE